MNPAKRIKLDKEVVDSETPIEYQIAVEQTFVHREFETSCRSENYPVTLHIGHLLKNVLSKLLSEEINETASFSFQTKSPEELLKDVMQLSLYEFLTEKDKANVVLLREKFNRLGLGDKDESLIIISAVEDLFHLIRKIRPSLFVPVELIQEFRAAYINSFTVCNDSVSQFPPSSDGNSVCELLGDTLIAMNHICGVLLDHYKIPHDFLYCRKNSSYSDLQVRHLLVNAYPNVHTINRLLRDILDAVNRSQSVKTLTKTLASALLQFIPSLSLLVEPKKYPYFNEYALESWLTSSHNRPILDRAIMQIGKYSSKLQEAFYVMVYCKKSPNN